MTLLLYRRRVLSVSLLAVLESEMDDGNRQRDSFMHLVYV